jgi:hypothetical protein
VDFARGVELYEFAEFVKVLGSIILFVSFVVEDTKSFVLVYKEGVIVK